jgi:hypothetical protein
MLGNTQNSKMHRSLVKDKNKMTEMMNIINFICHSFPLSNYWLKPAECCGHTQQTDRLDPRRKLDKLGSRKQNQLNAFHPSHQMH